MSRHVVLAALFAFLVVASTALAQDTSTFGRASGGQIDMAVKQGGNLSGSLGMTLSRFTTPFAGNLKNFDATLGGTLVKDRVWFFGTAQRVEGLRFDPALMQSYGKMTAQTGDKLTLTGSAATLPSSFLSLHYTGIVSSNWFVTGSVSRSSAHPRD